MSKKQISVSIEDRIKHIFSKGDKLEKFIFNHVIDGYWYVSNDLANGITIWLSRKLWRSLGYDIETELKMVPSQQIIANSSEIDGILHWSDTPIEEREEFLKHTLNFYHQDGSIVYMKSKGFLDLDEHDTVQGVFGFCEDISDEHEMDSMMIESNLSARTGSWSVNLIANTIYWDEITTDIHGREPDYDPTLTEAFDHYKDGWSRNSIDAATNMLIETGDSFDQDFIIITPKKEEVWVRVIGHCEIKEDVPVKIYGLIQDITEFKKAEQIDKRLSILKRKSEELEQFAYIASHDLREPLRTIKGYIEILKSEYLDKSNDEATQIADRSLNTVNRLESLIKDLLQYSKNSKISELSLISLDECVKEAIGNLGANITETGATINSEQLPEVQGNKSRLVLLFQNLIGNAIKFCKTDCEPSIDISVNSDKKAHHIIVRDEGIGIKEKSLSNIFLIFKRVHDHAKVEGSGIGLAICKKIVELHGGKIEVESEYGKYTEFIITLPKQINQKK